MHRKASYLLIVFLFVKINIVSAQDLTGTWEGDLARSEFLQVNIVQVGDRLCGYTWDYLYYNQNDFCKAYFTGRYDKAKKQWILNGTSFLANSGSHVLMRIVLSYQSIEGKEILTGRESTPSQQPNLLSILTRHDVYLQKVSDKPSKMLRNMQECMEEKQKNKDDSITVVMPTDTLQKMILDVDPVKNSSVDTVRQIKPPVAAKDSIPIISEMAKRKNIKKEPLVVNEKEIVLEVFDNGIIDSDTVSIFYNGKLILSHKLLSEKAIVIPISLNEQASLHEITLFAENLGSIPPNTALIVVHAGKKRYELFASASLTENAVIRFEYKPK